MFIQTESTPNPATLKFLPGQTVLEIGTADFPSADTSEKSPLAKRLFAVDGVTGVFLGHDFVTVTKADGLDWDHLKPALATRTITTKRMQKWSARSKRCSTRGCARLLRKMAGISPFTGLIAAWSICTCRAHARAAPLRH